MSIPESEREIRYESFTRVGDDGFAYVVVFRNRKGKTVVGRSPETRGAAESYAGSLNRCRVQAVWLVKLLPPEFFVAPSPTAEASAMIDALKD